MIFRVGVAGGNRPAVVGSGERESGCSEGGVVLPLLKSRETGRVLRHGTSVTVEETHLLVSDGDFSTSVARISRLAECEEDGQAAFPQTQIFGIIARLKKGRHAVVDGQP